ncbi:MAG TPA: metal ABC transporter permease [Tepidisphaeraceae bacterium]|nr:metal ABC transporter permease [Tepidisphaeraceae bacterium]
MTWLLAPFHYPFMLTAFFAVILIGITCAVLACYVVLRRMAFIGDAIAHTALPGIVIAYLKGFNLFLGALTAGLLTALGIGWLSSREAVREDTAIGVLFTAMFALGVLIISTTRSYQDFSSLFFGNILGITPADLILIAIITVVILIVVTLLYKELELTSVDPTYAAVIGLRADRMRNILLVLLALSVVTGIQAVGVILTSALLVTPAAAASLLTRKLFRMMILSSFFAVTSGIVGLYASFYIGGSSAGAAIVLTGVVWFAIAFVIHHLPANITVSSI